jgi:phosphoglycerate-specific signal transduction histidine kinase
MRRKKIDDEMKEHEKAMKEERRQEKIEERARREARLKRLQENELKSATYQVVGHLIASCCEFL